MWSKEVGAAVGSLRAEGGREGGGQAAVFLSLSVRPLALDV